MRRLLWAAALLAALPAHGAHPLITEDTGTLGKGRSQLELLAEDGRASVTRAPLEQQAVVFSHGISASADLQAGLPWLRDGASRGPGDASLDLKRRFYERGAFSLGVKPGITLPTGDDGEALGAGRVGWGAQLIASYDPGPLAVHLHAGYRRNRNTLGERESLAHLSAALVYRTGPVKLVADLARDTNPDPAAGGSLRYAVLGVIWSPAPDFDLDAGIKSGRGEATLERALLLGATLRW